MFSAYVGAGLCSLLLNAVWGRWQWTGASTLGLGLLLMSLVLAMTGPERVRADRAA